MLNKKIFAEYSISTKDIKKFNILSDLFIFFNLADCISTVLAVVYLDAFEGNVIISYVINSGVIIFIAYKMLFTFTIVYYFRYLYVKNHALFSRKNVTVSLIILTIVIIMCCVNNIYWIINLV